jgi:hypothetical protein
MPGAVGGRVHPFGPVQPSNSGAGATEGRGRGRSGLGGPENRRLSSIEAHLSPGLTGARYGNSEYYDEGATYVTAYHDWDKDE